MFKRPAVIAHTRPVGVAPPDPCDTTAPAGNNWALGYHQHGARCAEAVVERARREVERCDHFGGFVMLQSLAGGTGAGFGSRIAHELCDYMPSAPRLSCAVWPYETGEVIVQAYNALLSIEMLYSVCDGVLLLQNEELHATCAVRCVTPTPPCILVEHRV